VESNDGPLKRISPLHPALIALQYPLLFPFGEKGFYLGIKYVSVDGKPIVGRKDVTMCEYYCHRCHYKRGQPNPYTCGGRLSEQIKVDAFSCVECDRLSFVRNNQDKLRSETYQGLSDAIGEGASTGKNVGVQVLLPSSFVGSRRYMAQNYQDAMAICRAYGAPDLFVTFTCNPKWDEILEALEQEPGQKASDRSDLVARVFKMKLDELYGDIRSGSAFGPVRAG
jgi:hypothetical protein